MKFKNSIHQFINKLGGFASSRRLISRRKFNHAENVLLCLTLLACKRNASAQTNNPLAGLTNIQPVAPIATSNIPRIAETNVATGELTNAASLGLTNIAPVTPLVSNNVPPVTLTNTPPALTNTPLGTPTNVVPAAPTINTNAVIPQGSDTLTNVTKLNETTVVAHADETRNQFATDIGASAYTMSSTQIANQSQGDNAPFNEIILRAPGVAQDSAVNGDFHVRGEHANLQYRINGVLLPEGITGFGLELDPRFVENLRLITGALPAQYGFRTAGVVDIQTKGGTFENGGDVEIYGGSHSTVRPSFELGGSTSNLNYFVDGSFEQNLLGIENPTSSRDALHDKTDQGKLFSYLSYTLDETSRFNVMLSASSSDYQIPNTPGLSAGNPGTTPYNTFLPGGAGLSLDSAALNENQLEQNYYAVLTYQKSAGDLSFQVSAVGRDSSVHFIPDQLGDLYFNGTSSDVYRKLTSGGLQMDATYQLGENHTIRGGAIFDGEFVTANALTTVFPADNFGNPTGAPLAPFAQNNSIYGLFTGFYLQDEWKILPKVTLNFGARFDIFNSSFDNENQLSPRVNLVYQPTDSTTIHGGYARYFTPPPVENIPAGDVHQFDGTTGQSPYGANAPAGTVLAERADYFDLGATQEIVKGLHVGVDSYYKQAKNQLDDGLFGQTLILSAFNYSKGEIYGTEFTIGYDQGGFSSYANIAYSVAKGEGFASSQFLFSQNDVQYSQNHYIALDHDQTVSGSFGMSYRFIESKRSSTLTYVDALYGSGLRADGGGTENGLPGGDPIPNGTTVPGYYSVNVGVEQVFKINRKQSIKARLDIVNLTDNIYELRDGSGVGVNAAQFGARRGIFGSFSYTF